MKKFVRLIYDIVLGSKGILMTNNLPFLKSGKYKRQMKYNISYPVEKEYTIKNKEELEKKLKEIGESQNYFKAFKYYYKNSNILYSKVPGIESMIKQYQSAHIDKMYKEINPIFFNPIVKRTFDSQKNSVYLNLLFFVFLLLILFGADFQKIYKHAKVFLKKMMEKKEDKSKNEGDLGNIPAQESENNIFEENEGFNSIFRQGQENEFKLAKNVTERLENVKGIDEVKEELEEIVSMLKDPKRYEEAGAKLIRGILLISKPGTGKTLLARALAGESKVNFIYVTASEFDKGLVGQGSMKIKELFQFARKKQPCIIFIDEIDSLLHKGRRSGKYTTSSDRGVINTFLAEMDGFKKREYVFVMGATNFDNLDPAALRPGRFDKVIHVPIPDTTGRKDIFDLYLKRIKLKIHENIDSQILSKMTPGFTGAEIENMVNHAVIQSVDKDSLEITKVEFEEARDRIMLGLKRKSGFKTNKQLLYSAVHEAGHTLVCYLNPLCKDNIYKVNVTPRGTGKGKLSTLFDDREGNKNELLTMIDLSLGGVIAEELYFGIEKVSEGCGNDLHKAVGLANSMVKTYGMNKDDWGYMVVNEDVVVDHRISGNTRDNLDTASQKIIETSSKRVRSILNENINKLKDLAQMLCVYEELTKEDIDHIMKGTFDVNSKERKREMNIQTFAL
jgi:ATP-dependent metalloprotease